MFLKRVCARNWPRHRAANNRVLTIDSRLKLDWKEKAIERREVRNHTVTPHYNHESLARSLAALPENWPRGSKMPLLCWVCRVHTWVLTCSYCWESMSKKRHRFSRASATVYVYIIHNGSSCRTCTVRLCTCTPCVFDPSYCEFTASEQIFWEIRDQT